MNRKPLLAAVAALALVTGLLGAESSRFPSSNPDLRVGTPNDPDFDCAEPDDEDGATCAGDLFGQQFNLFGFAPDASKSTALYLDSARAGEPQISGVSADAAWKVSIGQPQAVVAVLDTGIRWNNSSLRRKIFLNRGELPRPRDAEGVELNSPSDLVWGGYDVNGDGYFNGDDYTGDARVSANAGPNGVAGLLDAQDLIKSFSDGVDDDHNGYVDDIAGWDFFEDDNDPADLTSYSAANGHGTGRATDAAEETDDGQGAAGVCPRCTVMPLRVWDTFVSPGDTWAAATVYLADMGVAAQEVALGMLQNSKSGKAANRYAFDKGVALMQVSSDLNTADHNYPTNYNESVYINGCVADVHGLSGGSNEIISGFPDPTGGTLAAPVGTWFRNSGLTQYGAKANVCYVATTGSQATGQAAGGAALLASRGIELAASIGGRLRSNEIKQLLTQTAEDVLPENTLGTGIPDPAQVGFDEHFGYGRAHLGNAIQRIAPGKIPPEGLIESPAWWHLLDPVGQPDTASDRIAITGFVRANRSASCTYRLEYGLGVEPTSYTVFQPDTPCPSGATAELGQLPIDTIANAIPGSRTGSFETLPGERADPNHAAFTVRLVIEDGESPKNRGEDRKVYFAWHDPSAHPGWPKFVDVGGETSPVLYDVDGDGSLEILDSTSAGELCVYRHDGSPLPSFAGGQCWLAPPAFWFHPGAPGFQSGAVPPVTGGLRTVAVADLDGDFEPDLVVPVADGRIFVLRPDGSTRLTLGVDPAYSAPARRNGVDHPKRGLLASVTLADLDQAADGQKEIIVPALDGHLYVWNGRTGLPRTGFPKEIRETPAPAGLDARGELIYTAVVANIDADAQLEIVTGSADVIPGEPKPPSGPPPIAGGSGALVQYFLENSAGASTRVYAVNDDGSFVPGWPVSMTGLLPDVLPFVGPQHGGAAADLDGDGRDEIIASMTTGDVVTIQGDGSSTSLTANGVIQGGVSSSASRILNLFEASVVGDVNGVGQLDVVHLGVSAEDAVNLLLVGQNIPFNYALQVWDTATPENYAPGFPVAHDDFSLLSSAAIANVDGTGMREVLAGSGLYLLHAYDGSTGIDAAGFPKLTGGWQFAVPAIGDVDGDGKLNLVTSTREGYRFVWDLAASSASANNSEWWTEGHDECHSNRYGTDCRPPNRVRELQYDKANQRLQFVAPGDDWASGQVAKYQLRTSPSELLSAADWDAATVLPDVTATAAAGAAQQIAFANPASPVFVAVVPVDDQGNRARFQQVPVGNFPPVARLSVTPNPAAKGRLMLFDGAASNDPGGSVVEYRYNFGDGSPVLVRNTAAAVGHAYPQRGEYLASLVVKDDEGGLSVATGVTVRVTNTPPVAALSLSPDNGRAPLQVSLDASASQDSDLDDRVVFWHFDFGDGSSADSAAPVVSHTYTAPGSYTATVLVYDRDNDPSLGVASAALVVIDNLPVASLVATPNPQGKRQLLSLDGSASRDNDGDAISEYRFLTGRGSEEVRQSGSVLSLSYAVSGSYSASLSVKDARGNVSSNAATVLVQISNSAPLAQLTATPGSGRKPLDVRFDGRGSSDPDVGDAPLLYRYDFGDGKQQEAVVPVVDHRYLAAGSYQARLTVYDEEGKASSTVSQTVRVLGVAPVAELRADRDRVATGDTVHFDGSGSSDADGDAISLYEFDFGDGSAPLRQAGASADHLYAEGGRYNASLRVTDASGEVSVLPSVRAIQVGSSGGGGLAPGALLGLLALAALRRRSARRGA
ncbi:MAG: PKD domain-containing protein [Stagnimonas sp.]|nr:PKD domain-containing protein [Stagnimonas sp.]